jgi:hypothetical protein
MSFIDPLVMYDASTNRAHHLNRRYQQLWVDFGSHFGVLDGEMVQRSTKKKSRHSSHHFDQVAA